MKPTSPEKWLKKHATALRRIAHGERRRPQYKGLTILYDEMGPTKAVLGRDNANERFFRVRHSNSRNCFFVDISVPYDEFEKWETGLALNVKLCGEEY